MNNAKKDMIKRKNATKQQREHWLARSSAIGAFISAKIVLFGLQVF